MKLSSKREAGFYLAGFSSILCFVISYKSKALWYVIAGLLFLAYAVYAYRRLLDARKLERLEVYGRK